MSKLIIITVGTSITEKPFIFNIFNHEIKSLEDEERPDNYDYFLNECKNIFIRISANHHSPITDLSAELASLVVFKKKIGIDKGDVIALFSTNTESGKFCASVNYEVLKYLKWVQVENLKEPKTIKGFKLKPSLSDEDIATPFNEIGVKNFIREIDELLKFEFDYTFFNITGGFKAIIPHATIIAHNNKMTLFYLYEKSNQIITIKTFVDENSKTKVQCETESSYPNREIGDI